MLVVSCQNWCMRAVCRALAAVTAASCWIVCTRSLFLFSDCCNCPAFFFFFFTQWRLFCCYLKVYCLPRISKLHFISVAITCTNNLIYCKCTELQCPEAYLKLACFSVLKKRFLYIFPLIYFKQTVCSHFHSTWHHGHFGKTLIAYKWSVVIIFILLWLMLIPVSLRMCYEWNLTGSSFLMSFWCI